MKNMLKQDTRISVKVFTKSINLLAVTLILSGLLVHTNAVRLDEAACIPRPVPVPVTVTNGNEVLPYHVLLHRCSGTCHNSSPRVKTCVVKNSVDIELEVTNVNNQKENVNVNNHTSCQCLCVCKPDEISTNPYHPNCQCIKKLSNGPVSSDSRKSDEQKQPIPYLIAIVGVGIFALIVLLFDAILYFKKTGFSRYVKDHVCSCSNQEKPKMSKTEQQVPLQTKQTQV